MKKLGFFWDFFFSKCRFDYFYYFLGIFFPFLILKIGRKKKKNLICYFNLCRICLGDGFSHPSRFCSINAQNLLPLMPVIGQVTDDSGPHSGPR
jgi:hypothetical protein